MNHRVMTLALAASLACLASQSALAQGCALQWSQQGPGTNPGCRRASRHGAPGTAHPFCGRHRPPLGRLHRGHRQPEPVTNYEVRSRVARIEQQLAQQGGNAPAPHAN